MNQLPWPVWLIVVLGVIGLPALTFAGLWRGSATGPARTTARYVALAAALAWALWGVTSLLLAHAHVYRLRADLPNPLIGVAALAAFGVALACTRIPAVSRLLAAPDILWRLTFPQILRVGGVAFVTAYALGHLPPVFAIPAGFGDIAIGIEAIFMTRNLRRGTPGRGAVWFNLLGILDLIVAFTIAFTAAPGRPQILPATPTTEILGNLPLVLIPTVMVPMALALHVVSLTKIRATARAARLAAQPAVLASTPAMGV
ncbi:hypothetical protein ACIP5Y_01130 [Nocardia sp. NPDC088792]|uniref:hypothetical protein n=1 Tax=Nocardia sp. NPDC088792 TaxID=3364332 RepID=UPI0037FE5FC3